MTKPRQPLTQYRALENVAELLSWETCAEIVELSVSQTRKLGDPDTGRELKFRDAIRLDVAYRQAGGTEASFFDVFGARLGIDTAVSQPCSAGILVASGTAAKESGEALAAAIEAAGSNDPATRQRAIREIEESVQAFATLLNKLKSQAPGG